MLAITSQMTAFLRLEGDDWSAFSAMGSDEVLAPALEIPSSVFNDGHEITALIDENVIAAGFEPQTAAS